MGYCTTYDSVKIRITPVLNTDQERYMRRWLKTRHPELDEEALKEALGYESKYAKEAFPLRLTVGLPAEAQYVLAAEMTSPHKGWRTDFRLDLSELTYLEDEARASASEVVEELKRIHELLARWGRTFEPVRMGWDGEESDDVGTIFISGADIEAVNAQFVIVTPDWFDPDPAPTASYPALATAS